MIQGWSVTRYCAYIREIPLQSPMFAQLSLLAKTNFRAFRSKAGRNLRESKLLLFTLTLFLVGYLFAAYFGFSKGLEYLYRYVPGVGLLLLERVLYMLYFFFFIMLVFSNAVLIYSGLFRGKEMSWLLTLPLSQRSIFCWKLFESLLVSSWGLLILSAPLLLAFGHTFEVGMIFYARALAMFVPFLILPATLAAIVVVLLVRLWGTIGKLLLWSFAAWVVYRGVESWLVARALVVGPDATSSSTSAAIRQVLSHTEIAIHPLLPSSWMTGILLDWARGFQSNAGFFVLLLLSFTLMGGWFCVELLSRQTYRCWNSSMNRKAARSWRKSGRGMSEEKRQIVASKAIFGWNVMSILGVGRVNAAILRKDLREFTRDPSQWIACAVLFGLLFLYSFNLDNFAFDPKDPSWVALISVLNFLVSSLAVSTLCTRFIYPLFSLEGRRLWIVGLAPFPLTRIFWLKILLFAGSIAVITSSLMFISGTRLLLPWEVIFRFMGAICLVSFGLTSLSLGLGVLFPNYTEPNPSKIVAGFGGTLCLILNFLFIFLFITMFAAPIAVELVSKLRVFEKYSDQLNIFCNVGVVVLTGVTAGLPIILSIRRIKRLELLGKL